MIAFTYELICIKSTHTTSFEWQISQHKFYIILTPKDQSLSNLPIIREEGFSVVSEKMWSYFFPSMDIQAVGIIWVPTAGQLFKLSFTDISSKPSGDHAVQNSAFHKNINWIHLGL